MSISNLQNVYILEGWDAYTKATFFLLEIFIQDYNS